jgi:hypothetical protein
MDEEQRSARRIRRRERRMLRRIERFAPIAVVGLAMMLSTGVVKVMEVPGEPLEEPQPVAVVSSQPAQSPTRVESFLTVDPRPDLLSMLSVSLLDHEIHGPPEEDLARDRARAHVIEETQEPLS